MTKYLSRAALILATVVAMLVPVSATMAGATGAVAVKQPQVSSVAQPGVSHAKGPFAVGVRTVTFVDTSRPTMANGTVPAKPSRTLVTTIWYPARGPAGGGDLPNAPAAVGRGPFPLIVFSHGFGANGPAYGLLLRQFAAAGYVVAAPTFPLSSGGAPGGPNLTDYVNQPADVSFVITQMLRLDHDGHTGLTNLIARHHIGVAGHSLGAITTLGLLNTCCIDKRIDAAVPISGLELPFPGGTFTFQRRTPLMLIHGDADNTVPYAGSKNVFAQAQAPKFFLTLIGAPHTPFFGPAGPVIVQTMTDFFDRYLKDEHGALIRLFTDAPVPGISSLAAALR